MNFLFLRDVLSNYFGGGRDKVKKVVADHVKRRGVYLNEIKDTEGGLLGEYLSQAKIANNN